MIQIYSLNTLKTNLRKIINSFRTYQRLSGIKINLDKTEIVPLGTVDFLEPSRPFRTPCGTLSTDQGIFS